MRIELNMGTGRPTEDGQYLVILPGYKKKYKYMTLDFTVEAGWNTFRDHKGILHVPDEHKESLWNDVICWTPTDTYSIGEINDVEDRLVELEDKAEELMKDLNEESPILEALDLAHDYLVSAYKTFRREGK